MIRFLVFCVILVLSALPARADDGRKVGEVNTAFQLIGPDHKIKIAAFDDPKVQGVTCFVSRPTVGGLKGFFGVAEDPSDASIACRQTGPIHFVEAIRKDKGEDVFDERRSLVFKTLHVTRFYDAPSQTLVYLTWSDKLINGSPKNAVSAVTLAPWGTTPPDAVKLK